MATLIQRQTLFGNFVQTKYKPVVRCGPSYQETEIWAIDGITQALAKLKQCTIQNQTARLIRDEIDFYLVRYHNYCIKENIGAHYREVGATKKECDFEHVIPKAVARELLIYGIFTIDEALNVPTCLLRKKNHKLLNKTSASTTPNIWNFWLRYQSLGITIETHKGDTVDLNAWNLADHYNYFGIK